MTAVGRSFGFGLVGCGGAARDIARGIAATEGARLVAVVDLDHERAGAFAAAHAATPERSLGALLARDDVDAVVVALPHDRLARTAVTALRAGRHVLVEKPAATSAGGIRSIRDAAASNDRRVGVMLELRHVGTVGVARELVARGALGRLRAVRIRTLIDKPPSYWSSGPTGAVHDSWRASRVRAGGGVVLMNTIHQLDLVRLITGLEPRRVAGATAAGVAGVDVEDVAAATVEWSGGVIGGIVAAAHAPGAADEETIELDGDAGAVRLGDPYAERPSLRWLARPPNTEPDAARPVWQTITPPPEDPFAATIAGFVDAIRTDRPPVPGLAEVDVALATVLALYRSARTGRFEPVRPVGPAATAAAAS
jgi:predicted dehydrogenase